jgi:hypothetical protein
VLVYIFRVPLRPAGSACADYGDQIPTVLVDKLFGSEVMATTVSQVSSIYSFGSTPSPATEEMATIPQFLPWFKFATKLFSAQHMNP